MNPPITIEEFEKILSEICDRETSQDPDNWVSDNPLWGHCAVVSAVAQNLFGGELRRASLEGNPGFGKGSSHYWNLLPGGREIDFTRSQFGTCYPQLPSSVPRTREYVLFGPEDAGGEVKQRFESTRARYKILTYRLAKRLTGNPLFEDEIYRRCLFAALESLCKKRWFGCMIFRNDFDGMFDTVAVYEGCNQMMGPLRSLCEPECIRLKIKSRTESMLGACGHAEELGLWEMVKRGVPLKKCDFYVAGLDTRGMPLIKTAPGFTCLRCALQLYNAGVRRVFTPVSDRWVGIAPEEAVEAAKAYAIQEKSV